MILLCGSFSKSGKKELFWLFEASSFFPCFRDCFRSCSLFSFLEIPGSWRRETHHSSFIIHINTAFGWQFPCFPMPSGDPSNNGLVRSTFGNHQVASRMQIASCISLLSLLDIPSLPFYPPFLFCEECIYLLGAFFSFCAYGLLTSLGDGRSGMGECGRTHSPTCFGGQRDILAFTTCIYDAVTFQRRLKRGSLSSFLR